MNKIVEWLQERVRNRTTALLGDLGLFEHALMALSKQSRVTAWVRECFTEAEAKDAPERSLRTAEEALELAQAVGVDAETLHRLVDYVFSRPMGEPAQEIAGTMVTLYAMANALDVDADAAFETELARIQTPEVIERCRRRQHEKREALAGPIMSPAALAALDAGIESAKKEPSVDRGSFAQYADDDEPQRLAFVARRGDSPVETVPTPFEGPKKRKSWNP